MKKMRILHTVESYFPAVGGMPEVVRQLSERLVLLGHDITVATKKHPARTFSKLKGVKIVDFDINGNLVYGITGEKENYEKFLLESDFDIVTNFAAQQWATDIALPLLEKIKGKKVNVPTGFSGRYDPAFYGYFEKMKIWMHAYDINIFLSADYRDINFARENGIYKNTIIPNGAGADEFQKSELISYKKSLGIIENNFLILHVGGYTTQKGQLEALKIFYKSKIRNATLLMIGYNNHLLAQGGGKRMKLRMLYYKILNLLYNKKTIITYRSRAETVAAYQAANLFLFPSQIECSPIVLFECMASHTPFLTSDVGNTPEIIEWSRGGQLLPTVKDADGLSHVDINLSAELLTQLVENKNKRGEMAAAGFSAWKNKFSWEIISKQYEKLYFELISNTCER